MEVLLISQRDGLQNPAEYHRMAGSLEDGLAWSRQAGLATGDTAGLATCATTNVVHPTLRQAQGHSTRPFASHPRKAESNGSAGNGKNRTDWSLAITVAIPFSRWGAEPFVASPIIFPRATWLKAQSPAPPEKNIPPTHPFQLALLWQQQIKGDPKLNQAGIAAREGLSRARVTQVMNLLRLPEQVQSDLLNPPPPLQIHSISERHLRRLLSIEDDEVQLRDWLELLQKLKNAGGE